ncbi:MAG TPA: hypothetical protein VMV94_10565 [Phycisphaerae bacterium]|nr:hypothetical protein [Phycisphaerae bacterium]
MNRRIPPVLWVALVALGVYSLVQLGIGVARGSLPIVLAVAVNIILGVGLYRGARWAFALILVFGIAGVVATFVKTPGAGLGVAVVNAIVLVPVVVARAHFFGPGATGPVGGMRYCPQCGRPMTAPPTVNCPTCNGE